MRWIVETVVFGGLAVGMHVVVMSSPQQGEISGGDFGTDAVALIGISTNLTAMVETWDAPPAAQSSAPLGFNLPTMPDAIALPMQTSDAPEIAKGPAVLDAPSAPTEVFTPPAAPVAPAPPKVIEPPAPKPDPAPKPTPKSVAKYAPENAETEREPSAGQKARLAAGTGGGTTAGASTSASAAPSGKSKRLEAAWHAKINSRVHSRMRYPRGVDVGSTEVVIRIVLATTGHLQSVSVVRSSGSGAIDAAAIEAVRRSGRFPRAPKGVTNPTLQFNLTMRFNR